MSEYPLNPEVWAENFFTVRVVDADDPKSPIKRNRFIITETGEILIGYQHRDILRVGSRSMLFKLEGVYKYHFSDENDKIVFYKDDATGIEQLFNVQLSDAQIKVVKKIIARKIKAVLGY
jgi:hypothetical protein